MYMGKWKYLGMAILLLFCFQSCDKKNESKDSKLSTYVNPFIGASTNIGAAGAYHGLGKTFPGATTPYGMVQVSPNTISGGDNSSGYSYEHKTIEGFALTQMSGVGWYGDLGNFLVMPTTGKLQKIAGKEDGTIKGYRSKYSKKFERAEAGYYYTELTDYDIKVETSATPHCGIMKFTYPENKLSRIQIDLSRRIGGTAHSQQIEVLDNYHISGAIKCTPKEGGWGNGEGNVGYTLYFYGEFSKPLENYGFWSADIPTNWVRKREEVQSLKYQHQVAKAKVIKGKKRVSGKHVGFFSDFETFSGEEVILKVGVSFIDVEGAKRNFQKEIANIDFEEVRKRAAALWDEALAKIKIEGGNEDEKTVFYTSLYHTMIDPRIFADVDGRYIGGDGKIHQTKRFTKRTIFSGWDVFRAQMPLQTIINPSLVNDELNSLITLASESGKEYFERWELMNAYTGCMLGNPALVVLADAYRKGIKDYDTEKAFRYAVNSSDKFSPWQIGFDTTSLSISKTLEFAYADWCAGQYAKDLGHQTEADTLLKRAQMYRNLYDPSKGWFRPRRADGKWDKWPEKAVLKEFYGCMECNPLQQGWFVPHDIQGLVELLGGKEKVLAILEDFFAKTPKDMLWNSYYNHANEPVHHVPFLFNRLGKPWLTQYWSRFVCRNAYFNSVEGLVGNEDAGQMSAWYVLASAGIYPVCPGDNRYEISSPVFSEIKFAVPATNKEFTIKAYNNSVENVYIQSAKLNGVEYNKCYLTHDDILNGATLELFMGATPNECWGIEN